jgi:LysR family transcriptional regulator, glycine cleavage system transcriptional activator
MRRIPPLPAVRVFEAAARHENFTAAAAELGMTQAAVSYQIRIIEERLGVPLFLRSKRRVTLSEVGRRIAPLVTSAFDTLDDAFAAARAEDSGVLAISAAHTFATNWLGRRLGGFQVAHPDLAVRLHASNELVDFARDEIDVAVRAGRGPWPDLRTHFLYRAHFTPMCSPEFLAQHPLLREPADLSHVPRVNPDDGWWRLWLEAAGEPAIEMPTTRGIRVDSQVIEGVGALSGQGAALLTPLLWRDELAAGRLVQLFPQIAFEGPSLWLVYPERKRNAPKVRAFREWLLGEIGLQAAAGPAEVFTPP